MFESFYTSFWQHPLLLWLFSVLFLLLVAPKGNSFQRTIFALVVLAIIDPLMTGPVTQGLELAEGPANALMIVFVLLGDFRFFFLVERFARPPGDARKAYFIAGLLTLVVPVTQAVLIRAFPFVFEEPRWTFLAYELLFFGFAMVYRLALVRRLVLSREINRWVHEMTAFVMLYYGLWAAADVIILSGADWGFLVRVVPNVLYYGLFIPFAYFRAPALLKASSSSKMETDGRKQ